MYKIILASFFLVFISCSKSEQEITAWGWKLSEINKTSNHISDSTSTISGMDILDFRSAFQIKNDTIYKRQLAIGYLIDYKPNTFSFKPRQIKIIHIPSGDTIRYVAKWEN